MKVQILVLYSRTLLAQIVQKLLLNPENTEYRLLSVKITRSFIVMLNVYLRIDNTRHT